VSYFRGKTSALNIDETRHMSHWAITLRLLEAGLPHDLIQELHEGEMISLLAFLRARDKKRQEDQEAQSNANRR
jgi:hypothetical protein